MVLIYDQDHIEKKTEKLTKSEKKSSRKLWLIDFVFGISFILLSAVFLLVTVELTGTFYGIIFIILPTITGVWCLIELLVPSRDPFYGKHRFLFESEPWFEYYQFRQTHTIANQKIEKTTNDLWVNLLLVGVDKKLETHEQTILIPCRKVKYVTTETLDMNSGIYYIPIQENKTVANTDK